MFKKILAYLAAIILLIGAVAFVYIRFLVPTKYPVFIESFEHGIMTVDNADTSGTDSKFKITCRAGSTLTITINPERTEKVYYNLDKLVVNGEDVTDDVSMLQYKVKVNSKLTVLAYFKKGSPSGETVSEETVSYDNAPEIIFAAKNEYMGSENAYDFEDPSIIYDSETQYYYCFGSGNTVARSKDLINWDNRTNYFQIPSDADSSSIMSFSAFPSVQKWAEAHGYDSDETFSSSSNNREPLAPDIIKIDSTYYLYFSLSKAKNANESAIFCVKTTDLAYSIENKDWQDVGIVISTCGRNSGSDTDNPSAEYDASNAVHPSVFTDKDGGLYLAYGSYYGRENIQGGIYLLQLNSKTGLLSKNSSINSEGETVSTLHGETTYNTGKLIANPGRVPALGKDEGSLVTGCDIVYNSKTKYYYMFVTYGTSQTNYNIRVARSKSAQGPYVDYNGEAMDEFLNKRGGSQYSKGLELIGGYNFSMSSNGGVSYVDVGKASTGSPSIIKADDGKWIMALQSRVYYKYNDEIVTGEKSLTDEESAALKVQMAPALEIRQIFFDENNWPLAVAEAYTGETTSQTVKMSEMEGNWDVLVFDSTASSTDYTAIERSVSQPVTILGGVAVSANNIEKKTKLTKLNFSKKDKTSYSMILDGVNYTIYPVIAWDWELSEGVITFSGIGDDGSTVWGKKNYSAYMGVYTDTFYYVLSLADEETKETYQKKMDKIKENPSQASVDSMTKKLISIVLAES